MQAIALAAIFAGTMLPLALIAIRESTGRRRGEVAAATEGERATALATQLADATTREQQALNREKEQRERADKLEDAWMAAAAAEPVAGASARMLAAIAAARAARGDGSGAVPAEEPAPRSRVGDTRLLRPGE